MNNEQLDRIELLLVNKGKIYAAMDCVEASASASTSTSPDTKLYREIITNLQEYAQKFDDKINEIYQE